MIQYISYADLNEFYSIKEVCRLLEMDKESLRKSCERMMTRGHDRTSYRSRDRSLAEDHEAAGTKNDRPTIDSGDEDRA